MNPDRILSDDLIYHTNNKKRECAEILVPDTHSLYVILFETFLCLRQPLIL